MNKKVLKVTLSLAVLTGVTGTVAPINHVDAQTQQSSSMIKLVKINPSKIQMNFGKDIVMSTDVDGSTVLTDQKSGVKQVLPKETLDSKGNEVNLVYKKNITGAEIHLVLKDEGSEIVTYSLTKKQKKFMKCYYGTVGTALGGALGGFSVGTVPGAVIGAVGGGMAGAAGSCF